MRELGESELEQIVGGAELPAILGIVSLVFTILGFIFPKKAQHRR
jgi:hypothetical protein